VRAVLARQGDSDRASLLSQLNQRRERLIALEAIRADNFLATPQQTLAEIEQLQIEISGLRKRVGSG
jgi:hypothetical protein